MLGCQGAWLLGEHAWLLGRHAWLLGGMCGCQRRVCLVAGGHVWLLGGVHGCWGACIGSDEIRSMSRWYASYWNAFLCGLRDTVAVFRIEFITDGSRTVWSIQLHSLPQSICCLSNGIR